MMTNGHSLVSEAQHVVYGTSFVIVMPTALVICSALLLAHRGLTEEEHMTPLNGFLANVLLSMIPLAALKWKVWKCADRVSLMPMVIKKTLLMHVFLGMFRVLSPLFQTHPVERLTFAADFGLFVAALAILKQDFDFPMNPVKWLEHSDVQGLVVMSCVAAFLFESYLAIVPASWLSDAQAREAKTANLDMSKILFTAANYLDIVAFMPVVWRLYQAEEHEDSNHGAVVTSSAKQQLQRFFLFIGAFYMHDDVVDPVMVQLQLHEPIGMMAHAAHFTLLLDLMGFFAFQVSQPVVQKEQGEQLRGLLSRMDDDEC